MVKCFSPKEATGVRFPQPLQRELINMWWNITALAFGVSTLISLYITVRAFFVWKRDLDNTIGQIFAHIFIFLTLYMGIRAFVSFLFPASPSILSGAYIMSHVFLGIGAAYVAKLGLTPVARPIIAQSVFLLFVILFALDVGLTLLLPNSPSFDSAHNIIDWGTNEVVGIFHTMLLWSTFLLSAGIFLFKTVQCWRDPLLRYRFLLISLSLVFAILIVIPRNIFHTPGFIFVSDVGFAVSFFLALWGISWGEEKHEFLK